MDTQIKKLGLKKKLVKHGNSYALVIDKVILELLGIDPNTELELSTDGNSLKVMPSNGDVVEPDAAFSEAVAFALGNYDEALQELAK